MATKVCTGKIGKVGMLPVVYASGYGRDPEITAAVNRCGKLLAALFPTLDFELRCNSDGLSGGACYDGEYHFNLGACKFLPRNDSVWNMPSYKWERALKRRGTVKYQAFMYTTATKKALSQIPHINILDFRTPISVSSPLYDSPYRALAWLLHYGKMFCPPIKRHITQSPYEVAKAWENWCGPTPWSQALREFGKLGGRIKWLCGYPRSKSAIPLAFVLYAPNGTKLNEHSRLKDILEAVEKLKARKFN